jgi:hypothetical protein
VRARACACADKITVSFELNLEFVGFSGCADMAYNSTAPDESFVNTGNARFRLFDEVRCARQRERIEMIAARRVVCWGCWVCLRRATTRRNAVARTTGGTRVRRSRWSAWWGSKELAVMTSSPRQ